jgi:hypothetical protein
MLIHLNLNQIIHGLFILRLDEFIMIVVIIITLCTIKIL